jgi:uncharacterized delta-60 repeat protein
VARFTTTGILDKTFSGDGKEVTAIDGSYQDYGAAVAIQQDGKIIVGGTYYKNSTNKADIALVRYTTSGKPDSSSFGYDGRVITDFNHQNDSAKAMVIQQDGKLIVAGNSNNDFAVARYNLAASTFNLISKSHILLMPSSNTISSSEIFPTDENLLNRRDEKNKTIVGLSKKNLNTATADYNR